MTKRYEEVVRGNLHELWQWSKSKEMLGEFTVVIAGFNPSDSEHSDQEIADRVKRCEAAGISRKEAINIVAKELKIPKRKVFDVMVEYK
jgi:16S rRNA (cytidine1402-2'-O)-methyltransferase